MAEDRQWAERLKTRVLDHPVVAVISAVVVLGAALATIYGEAFGGPSAPGVTYRVVAFQRFEAFTAPDAVLVVVDSSVVEDLTLVTLAIENTGGQPIRPEDYARPLRITYGPAARVLRASPGSPVPGDLDPVVTPSGNGADVDALLLNPGDSFEVTALVEDAGRPLVTGRIASVSRIEAEGVAGLIGAAEVLLLVAVFGMMGLGWAVTLMYTLAKGVTDESRTIGVFVFSSTVVSLSVSIGFASGAVGEKLSPLEFLLVLAAAVVASTVLGGLFLVLFGLTFSAIDAVAGTLGRWTPTRTREQRELPPPREPGGSEGGPTTNPERQIPR